MPVKAYRATDRALCVFDRREALQPDIVVASPATELLDDALDIFPFADPFDFARGSVRDDSVRSLELRVVTGQARRE